MRKRILLVLQAIELIYKGIISFAYKNGNFWFIAIDNYDIYMSEKFKVLSKKWRKSAVGIKNDCKLIFCYLKPKEEKLVELAEQNNLILNIH